MLTDKTIKAAKPREKPFRLTDGKGLSIEIQPSGSRLWRFRYRFDGRPGLLSMGSYPEVSLSLARKRRDEARNQIADGKNPSLLRKRDKDDRTNTFESVLRGWHKIQSTRLDPANAKAVLHRLEMDVLPYLGNRPIKDITPPDLLEVLQRVEKRGAVETAHRLLSWCGQVFRYAVASGIVDSDPCRDLRGALIQPREKHFAALTKPEDVSRLLKAMDGYRGIPVTRAALLLGILTFVRPGNLRKAEWAEFFSLDQPDKAEWRIPGNKMKVKTERDFIVPLAPQAVRVLNDMYPLTGEGRFVFPCPRSHTRPMSNNAINAALRYMGFGSDEITGHGFRAMARTLSEEVLGFAPEVIEEQLAHGKAGPLRDAYNRTTYMPKRRELMTAWADYLDKLRNL